MMSPKRCYILLMIVCMGLGFAMPAVAANISDFVEITPYVEVESTYNDNVYEISKDTPLPKDAKERDDG